MDAKEALHWMENKTGIMSCNDDAWPIAIRALRLLAAVEASDGEALENPSVQEKSDMSTWDYRAWADRQWFCGTGENAPAPGMKLVAKSFEDECRRAFEAAYRLGQERMRERCAKSTSACIDPGGRTGDEIIRALQVEE